MSRTEQGRTEAVEAVLRGERVAVVAARLGVQAPAVRKWVRRIQAGEGLADRRAGNGRAPGVDQADEAKLEALVVAHPNATLDELRVMFSTELGEKVGKYSVRAAMKRRGIRVERPTLTEAVQRSPEKARRFRDVHRRQPEPGRLPTSLTDQEWAVLRPIFESNASPAGRKPKHPRREMLDAIFYVVRTGCAWRNLPSEFPPWSAVYALFNRWSRDGRLERMHGTLRQMWREREGRNAEPTAAIIDSQTAKTAEKGGSAVTMVARK